MTRRVAIVGCGLIGAKRAEALTADQRLVAVFDVDERRAASLAARHGATVSATAAGAFDAAGEDGLAVIATTHESLAPLAADALRAGCHVLLEKPGARRPDELDEVGELAATTARVVRVGFNHRFHPAIAEAARLVRSGRCGPVMVIRARYGHGGRLGYEREWRADRARSGGGELLDQGVHLIDLVEYLAGPSSLAYASIGTHFWPMEVEDNAFVHLRTDGGADAWLHASWTEWKNLFSFEVACRTAKLEITGLGGSYGPETLVVHEMSEQLGPPLTRSTQWPPGDGSWHAELEDVERAITGATSLGTTLAECRAHLGKVRDAYAR